MQTNALPHYDDSVNTTGCCPQFNPEGWDGRRLRFEDKPFLRAVTRSVLHVPVNMGKVFARVQARIAVAEAYDPDNYIVLSRDLSPWTAEHLFSVARPVPGEESVTLSGEFLTRVFDGPYSKVRNWQGEMEAMAREAGAQTEEVWFFYTTCPNCAKAYGRNPVVGVARIA